MLSDDFCCIALLEGTQIGMTAHAEKLYELELGKDYWPPYNHLQFPGLVGCIFYTLHTITPVTRTSLGKVNYHKLWVNTKLWYWFMWHFLSSLSVSTIGKSHILTWISSLILPIKHPISRTRPQHLIKRHAGIKLYFGNCLEESTNSFATSSKIL